MLGGEGHGHRAGVLEGEEELGNQIHNCAKGWICWCALETLYGVTIGCRQERSRKVR